MSTLLLPTDVVKSSTQNPRKLIIFSNPKVGKTTILSKLDNNLIIDLEDGSEFVDARKINVRQFARETGKSELAILSEIVQGIKAKNVGT